MATVELTEFFLNDAEDPSDYITLAYVGDTYEVESTVGGGVDHDYASGRSRSWQDESDVTRVTFTAAWLDADQIAWLREHRGRTVWFRDHLGLKVACEYHTAQVSYSTMPKDSPWTVHQMPLRLESVTLSEAV